MKKLEPATIMLASAPAGKEGFVTRMIKRRSRLPSESKTEFTHAGIIGRGGAFTLATVIEQTFPRLREVSLREYYSRAHLKFYRLKSLTTEDQQKIVTAMRRRIGERYGLLKLAGFYLDYWLSAAWSFIRRRAVEIRFFTRFNLTNRFVCSQVVAQVYGGYVDFAPKNTPNRLLGRLFKRPGFSVTPDDIDDYCKSHPELFEVMGEVRPTEQ